MRFGLASRLLLHGYRSRALPALDDSRSPRKSHVGRRRCYSDRAKPHAQVGPGFRRHGLPAWPTLRDRLLQNPAQLIRMTSSSQEPAYIEEGAGNDWSSQARMAGPAIPSQPFSFFSLDGGSQWEDTSYAPARVEGWGVNPGHACAALPSHNPWSIRA